MPHQRLKARGLQASGNGDLERSVDAPRVPGGPWVRPLAPLRLRLTYVVPVAPLIICWDGRVSALRVHRPEELRAMTASLAREGYTWEAGEAKAPGKPPIPSVLGRPTR